MFFDSALVWFDCFKQQNTDSGKNKKQQQKVLANLTGSFSFEQTITVSTNKYEEDFYIRRDNGAFHHINVLQDETV